MASVTLGMEFAHALRKPWADYGAEFPAKVFFSTLANGPMHAATFSK